MNRTELEMCDRWCAQCNAFVFFFFQPGSPLANPLDGRVEPDFSGILINAAWKNPLWEAQMIINEAVNESAQRALTCRLSVFLFA